MIKTVTELKTIINVIIILIDIIKRFLFLQLFIILKYQEGVSQYYIKE